VIARIVGRRLSNGWGQQVLIENRPGGGTNIGVPPSAWPTRHTLLVSCAVA
jgi:tripartite-type tricarboxylate transporter receptor subunit TctC